jgi:hypothetical protein
VVWGMSLLKIPILADLSDTTGSVFNILTVTAVTDSEPKNVARDKMISHGHIMSCSLCVQHLPK